MKVSKWQLLDEYCSVRVIEGGDINNVDDRVALIEKTPRVRIDHKADNFYSLYTNNIIKGTRYKNWFHGNSGTHYQTDQHEKERQWCDEILKLMGYELED
jgi:hypothetical protein